MTGSVSDDVKKLWTNEWIEHDGLRIIPKKETDSKSEEINESEK